MRTSWSVAFRKKNTGSILSDTDTPFTIIGNSLRYWAADPFVFKYNNDTYIFAEVYDRVRSRGTIGYSKYNGGSFSRWKAVIIEDHHLSFPYIFTIENEIFIMPEAHQAGELYLYKAIRFPDKWEKHKILFKGKKLADSVLLDSCGKTYVLSYEINYPEKNVLLLGTITENGDVSFNDEPVSDDVSSARPGGKFFCLDGKTVRVSQDCKESYGDGIVFSESEVSIENGLRERIIKRIGKENIKISDGTPVFGAHTYNSNEEFEVIDIKTKESNWSYIFSRPFRLVKKIKRRIIHK